jgi:hypothetical protein
MQIIFGVLFLAPGVLLLSLSVFGALSGARGSDAGSMSAGLIFALSFEAIAIGIGLLLLVLGLRGLRRANHFNERIWPGLMHEWRTSLICMRCGQVWRP